MKPLNRDKTPAHHYAYTQRSVNVQSVGVPSQKSPYIGEMSASQILVYTLCVCLQRSHVEDVL